VGCGVRVCLESLSDCVKAVISIRVKAAISIRVKAVIGIRVKAAISISLIVFIPRDH